MKTYISHNMDENEKLLAGLETTMSEAVAPRKLDERCFSVEEGRGGEGNVLGRDLPTGWGKDSYGSREGEGWRRDCLVELGTIRSPSRVCRSKWGFGSKLLKVGRWHVLLWLLVLYEEAWHCQWYSQLPFWWWRWWVFGWPCPRGQACARRQACFRRQTFHWRRLPWWVDLTSFSFFYFTRLWPRLSYMYIQCMLFWVFFFNMIALINFSSSMLSLVVCSYYNIFISNFYW